MSYDYESAELAAYREYLHEKALRKLYGDRARITNPRVVAPSKYEGRFGYVDYEHPYKYRGNTAYKTNWYSNGIFNKDLDRMKADMANDAEWQAEKYGYAKHVGNAKKGGKVVIDVSGKMPNTNKATWKNPADDWARAQHPELYADKEYIDAYNKKVAAAIRMKDEGTYKPSSSVKFGVTRKPSILGISPMLPIAGTALTMSMMDPNIARAASWGGQALGYGAMAANDAIGTAGTIAKPLYDAYVNMSQYSPEQAQDMTLNPLNYAD